MDREIDLSFRRTRILRRASLAALVVATAAVVFIWGPRLIQPTVARARIRTARVDAGPMEAQITASGTVTPEFEQVISSPVNARVLKILKRPGAILSKGEAILELGLNLAVREGEFISIMGPSGSGKSTLLNVIGLLDAPSGGSVTINQKPVTSSATSTSRTSAMPRSASSSRPSISSTT
jgi:ABC-type glutathione transport system ATPase component